MKEERASRSLTCGTWTLVNSLSNVLGSPSSLVAIRLPVVAPRLPSVSMSPACNSASDKGPALRVFRDVEELLSLLMLWGR